MNRHAAAAQVAARFKEATGDYIGIAGCKLAGVELRNRWRQNGIKAGNPLTLEPESDPYTLEQLKLLDQWEALQHRSSKYLFHTTPAANLPSIAREGLVAGKPQRFPGVSSTTRISLSANQAAAAYYGGESDVMLRVRKNFQFVDLEPDLLAGGDGVYTTGTPIPPESLEVRRGRKWVALVEPLA